MKYIRRTNLKLGPDIVDDLRICKYEAFLNTGLRPTYSQMILALIKSTNQDVLYRNLKYIIDNRRAE